MKMERQTLAHMPCYSSRHYAPLPDHGVPCRIRSGRRLQTARSNRAHGSASSSNSLAFGRLAMVYSSTSLPVASISCRDLCLLSIASTAQSRMSTESAVILINRGWRPLARLPRIAIGARNAVARVFSPAQECEHTSFGSAP